MVSVAPERWLGTALEEPVRPLSERQLFARQHSGETALVACVQAIAQKAFRFLAIRRAGRLSLYFSFPVSVPDLPKLRIVSLINRAFTFARPSSFTAAGQTVLLMSLYSANVNKLLTLQNAFNSVFDVAELDYPQCGVPLVERKLGDDWPKLLKVVFEPLFMNRASEGRHLQTGPWTVSRQHGPFHDRVDYALKGSVAKFE